VRLKSFIGVWFEKLSTYLWGDAALKEVQEALVNGPAFQVSSVPNSIGWAATKVAGQNCTFVLNGIAVSRHVFGKEEGKYDEITFKKGDESITCMRHEAKDIGYDTLWFSRKSSFKTVPQLHAGVPRLGHCMLLRYQTEEAMKENKWVPSSGSVKSIISDAGAEKAYYNCSSEAGACGAPVVNEFGHVIGFHNFTSSTETGFIPLTALMVAKATGSVQSFC